MLATQAKVSRKFGAHVLVIATTSTKKQTLLATPAQHKSLKASGLRACMQADSQSATKTLGEATYLGHDMPISRVEQDQPTSCPFPEAHHHGRTEISATERFE